MPQGRGFTLDLVQRWRLPQNVVRERPGHGSQAHAPGMIRNLT